MKEMAAPTHPGLAVAKFGAPNPKPLKGLDIAKRIFGRICRNLLSFVGRNQQNQRLTQHDLEESHPGRFFGTGMGA
jgi:hypothetical protein